MFKITTRFNVRSTYKVTVNVVKAEHMFDDHVVGEDKAAQSAEVISLLSWLGTNTFNNVLQSWKIKEKKSWNFSLTKHNEWPKIKHFYFFYKRSLSKNDLYHWCGCFQLVK